MVALANLVLLEDSSLLWVSLVTLFFAGCVKGVVGLGLPTVTLAIVTIIIDLPTAMVILIIPSFVTNLIQALTGGNLQFIWRRTRWFMLFATLCIVLGALLFRFVQIEYLSLLLGGLITIYALSGLTRKKIIIKPATEPVLGPILGAVNGVLTGMTGSFVVPGVFYLKSIGLNKNELVQAMGVLFTLSTIGLGLSAANNALVNASLLQISLLATVPALLGMWIGQNVRNRISDHQFDSVFYGALVMLGIYLIWSVLF